MGPLALPDWLTIEWSEQTIAISLGFGASPLSDRRPEKPSDLLGMDVRPQLELR